MRVGYHWWGFISDYKLDENGRELSTPDGNATYSGNLIAALQRAGHRVYMMSSDRDWYSWTQHGADAFASHNEVVRVEAYKELIRTGGIEFPDLDVLILEWRFPIPGRNCKMSCSRVLHNGMFNLDVDLMNNQLDLYRQWMLLSWYGKQTSTQIYIWDLDHKITEDEEAYLLGFLGDRVAILETSTRPVKRILPRISVEPPAWSETFLEHKTFPAFHTHALAYIGSRYERDEQIDRWIEPFSRNSTVRFYGKWDDDAKRRWPHIEYVGRITTAGFREAYRYAAGVPLLAKESYRQCGFITPRPFEALVFGSMPIGLKGHLDIERYCLRDDVAESPDHLTEIVRQYVQSSPSWRNTCRQTLAEKLEFMDAKHFVRKIGL